MAHFDIGDKVIHKDQKDPQKYGHVGVVNPMFLREGMIGVRWVYGRLVYVKRENILHFEEWQKQHPPEPTPPIGENLRNYWG